MMKKYQKPNCLKKEIETEKVLDMSVTGGEYDNDQSLGKSFDDSGLQVLDEYDLWNDFWFGEEVKPDNTLEQFVAKK